MAKSKSFTQPNRYFGCFRKVSSVEDGCFSCACKVCVEARLRRGFSRACFILPMSRASVKGVSLRLEDPDIGVLTLDDHTFVTPIIASSPAGFYTDELHGIALYSMQLATLVEGWDSCGEWMRKTSEWDALRALFEVAGPWSEAADELVQQMLSKKPR